MSFGVFGHVWSFQVPGAMNMAPLCQGCPPYAWRGQALSNCTAIPGPSGPAKQSARKADGGKEQRMWSGSFLFCVLSRVLMIHAAVQSYKAFFAKSKAFQGYRLWAPSVSHEKGASKRTTVHRLGRLCRRKEVIARVSQGLLGELRILLTLAATHCWTMVMVLWEEHCELWWIIHTPHNYDATCGLGTGSSGGLHSLGTGHLFFIRKPMGHTVCFDRAMRSQMAQ